MKTALSLSQGFDLDEDLTDLGEAFVSGPIHRIAFNFNPETGLPTLATTYEYRILRASRWHEDGKLQWMRLLLRFAHDAYVLAYRHGSGRIYARTAAQAEAILEELLPLLEAPTVPKTAFYMVRFDGQSFEADAIENLPDALEDDFIRLAYGDDALSWMDSFRTRTTERQGGLTILEGPPGTGKTSLISEMIRRLRDTHLFYVIPVCNDSMLTASELVSFWQDQHRQHPDRIKVVVMEDAERILLGRSNGHSDAVAAVLNIADGLLGRMLRLHLVCSVNARFEHLDPAIQRPGRLMNYRTFGPMPRTRAVALASRQRTAFTPHPEVDEYTLAEVMQPAQVRTKVEQRRIGFAAV